MYCNYVYGVITFYFTFTDVFCNSVVVFLGKQCISCYSATWQILCFWGRYSLSKTPHNSQCLKVGLVGSPVMGYDDQTSVQKKERGGKRWVGDSQLTD